MNYAEAAAIIAEHAPDLKLDIEVKGNPHICVRARLGGPPFSIMLPTTDDTKADEITLMNSLAAAEKHMLGKG